MASCATPTSFAGHASATANSQLTFNPDHSIGADQSGKCFAQDDLYSVKWGSVVDVEIEKFFFGEIDNSGRRAVERFSNFQYDNVPRNTFQSLMTYMSVQKMRTPKGLGWLQSVVGSQSPERYLIQMQRYQNLFCAIWTECVWQIADASASPIKFIISDHPVTVYNRGCYPLSKYCTGFKDPDIHLVATHTYFPLSLDKILILTNRSWVRNPYQSEIKERPNPNYLRPAIFNTLGIQTHRSLSEQEVLQINYITKRRAFRYIAAAEIEWLYPEKYVAEDHWRKLGDGYLLMPEPRAMHMGGDIVIGYEGGRSEAYGVYGHKPWQRGYKDNKREKDESISLRKFKAEWAVRQGPEWRGSDTEFGRRETGPRVDSEDMHRHYVEEWERLRSKRR